MSRYRYDCDCQRCTNKYIENGSEWCKPMVDGHKTIRVTDDDAITCRYYTTQMRQMEMYPRRQNDEQTN